jgi:hypothetical protein
MAIPPQPPLGRRTQARVMRLVNVPGTEHIVAVVIQRPYLRQVYVP